MQSMSINCMELSIVVCLVTLFVIVLPIQTTHAFMDDFEADEIGPEWQRSPVGNDQSWGIEDGAFVGRGERSHLYYMAEQFKNFEFQSDVMINQGGNSGIYIHIEHHAEGWFFDGHEIQINNSHVDPVRTGSLWGVIKLYDSPVKDDEWFTVNITVKDQNVVVRVNGKIVIDYTEPEGAKGPRRLGQGYFALQQHDPGSTVRFRNIKVRKLP